MTESPTNENSTCVVCFKNVLYYSIGECDHPVCFECSTRMRVLCLQNECPICRHDLSRVVFTDSIQPYKELRNRVFTDRLFERQYKIGFWNEEIKNAYEQLLEHRCKICDKNPPFRTFTMLNDHVRRVHERYFCDLCVVHLKIFTSERRCYTRKELAQHRRKGDLDDTSHRGHPLCEFCEERFMDADELYRHLRKEHLYCHLCDADGRNQYYASHSALAHHFRNDHYLCEEGECADQHLTAVFRSEIDLKAHKATVHGRGMNRGAARQARTLELQFNITPHPVAQRAPRERERERERAPEPASAPPPAPKIDTRSDEQFPRLSAAPPPPNLVLAPSKAYKGAGGLTRNDRNFPALEGGAGPSRPPPNSRPAQPLAATILRNSKPSVSIQLHSQPASASNFRLTQSSANRISIPAQKKQSPLSDDDFPSLGVARDDHPSLGAGTVQPPKVALINSEEMQALKSKNTNHQPKKTSLNCEAFPALSSTSAPAAPPQWINVSRSKYKGKARSEPAPAPAPREPAFNPVADFPTLPVNNAKAKAKRSPPQPSAALASHQENAKSNGTNGNAERRETDRKPKTIADTASTANGEKSKNNNKFNLAPKEYPPLAPRSGKGAPGRYKCDGMTFINSAGQAFPAPLHTYIPPPDFQQRNRDLVRKVASALGDADEVEYFKVASSAFRNSIIGADDFYERCQSALGDQFDDLFPDLVTLLPDIAKQQELMVGRRVGSQLHVCPTCGQLLALNDRAAHDAAHSLAPR